MEFKFTDEQIMIRDTAEAFVSEVSTSAAVRSAMLEPAGYDKDLWRKISADMFWQALDHSKTAHILRLHVPRGGPSTTRWPASETICPPTATAGFVLRCDPALGQANDSRGPTRRV